MAKKKSKKLTKKQKKFILANYKVILVLVIILVIVIAVLGFIFKDEIKNYLKGPNPTTPSVSNIEITNDGKLSWTDAGSGAIYIITIDGEDKTITTNNFDVSEYQEKIKTGLLIEIVAKLPDHDKSYKKSITVNYNSEEMVYTFEYNFTYEGYYAGIDYKMNDTKIFEILNQKLNVVTAGNGSQNASYGEAREILVKSDLAPGKQTLYGIYDNAEIEANRGSGNIFQREHVWPNSRLGIPRVGNSSRDQGSDPHNLRAIIGSTNGSRSNRYFASGNGLNGYTIGVDEYYPGDNHRGDVARILLYMAVRYKDILTLVETPGGETYVPRGAQMGKLSLLLDWHNADPVDEFEINRNQVIFEYQGNRNPFIDHPELFERVYQEILSTTANFKKPIQVLDIIIKHLEIQKQSYFVQKEPNFIV